MMNEQQLIKALGELPRKVSPPQDVWSNIESGLGEQLPAQDVETRRATWQVWATACGVMALAGAIWLQFANVNTALPAPVIYGGLGQDFATYLDIEYSSALRDVTAERGDEALPDPQRQLLDQQLVLLQQAASDLRMALEQQPDAVYLAQMLESTHRKQLRLLRQMNELRV